MTQSSVASGSVATITSPPRGTRRRQLVKRLFSSAFLIGLVLATLFWFPLWFYMFVVTLFIGVGLFEFFTMVRHRGVLVHRPLGVCLGLVFTGLVAWRSMIEPGLVSVPVLGPGASLISWMWDIFWPATIVILFVRQFTRENTFEALSGLATTLFGLAYVAALFSYFFYIRTHDPIQGAWWVLYLILVTKLGDAGAYMIGSLIGRHTFMPRISPTKTIEGSVGAVIVSGITGALAHPFLGPEHAIGLWGGLALGVFLGIVGLMGDLAESLIKRDCQVKDAGTMPGLGGILDVIDSLLFTAPLFYGFLIYG